MYTRRNIRWSLILHFAWWQIIVFALWSGLVTCLFLWLTERGINCSLPITPLGTIEPINDILM